MNIVIILTGGEGKRLDSKMPKQFIEVDDKPLFIYTLETFLKHPLIGRVILTCNKKYLEQYKILLKKFHMIDKVELVVGGISRQESVKNSLDYLKDMNCLENDIILIHDGARPLVDKKIISDNIEMCLFEKKPVITAINLVDTIVDKDYNLFDRSNLLIIQTPQTFHFKMICDFHALALENGIKDVSDDGQLARRFNQEVCFVKGSRINIKITEKEDIELFKLFKSR